MLITLDRNIEDPVLVEPSKILSSFQVYALGRYGVLPTPSELRGLAKNTRAWKEDYLSDNPLYLAYTKPNREVLSSIAEGIIKSKLGYDYIYVTPGLAGEMLSIKPDIYFTIDDWIDKETVVQEYRKALYPDISPLATERLLKLFSLFYHEEFMPKEMKLISAMQKLLLANKEKDNISIVAKKSYAVINKGYKKIKEHQPNLPTANLVTKVLECLEGCFLPEYDRSGDLYSVKKDISNEKIENLKNILS